MPQEDTARRPFLIGEAPSQAGDRYYMVPLSGPPARVLCQCAGIPPLEGESTYGKWTWALYERFECHNLIRRYRDAEPWSVPRARERATEWRREHGDAERPPVVVLLGRRVAAAFGVPGGADHGDWTETGLMAVTSAPHPSGRSRAMNDPVTRGLVGRILNEAMERGRQ